MMISSRYENETLLEYINFIEPHAMHFIDVAKRFLGRVHRSFVSRWFHRGAWPSLQGTRRRGEP